MERVNETVADIQMPQLGESVTEGTLSKWLKQVGDFVDKYEPLAEVITDKVTAEIPSDFSGVLDKVLVPEGETVAVGTLLCHIRETDEVNHSVSSAANDEFQQVTAQTVSQTTSQVHEQTEPSMATRSSLPFQDLDFSSQTNSSSQDDELVFRKGAASGRYSPAVLRLVQDHGLDLREITGSGEGGRITRKDVMRYLEERSNSSILIAPAPGVQPTQTTGSSPSDTPHLVEDGLQPQTLGENRGPNNQISSDDVKVITPTPLRRIIAKRMVESKHTAPHAWTMVEADVTGLVAMRTRIKQDFKNKEGIDLTFLPFFIKAVTDALKSYPMLNAAWVEDKIHLHQRINISVAVATEDALAVPVIHDADRLSIVGIAHALNGLAAQARSGRLAISDVEGGTFTVNNTGAFGSVLSAPILNGGQAAILSVETIVKRPVVIQDAIAIRSMVNLSLSLDHRLLDGWIAGKFLHAVKERVEAFREGLLIY